MLNLEIPLGQLLGIGLVMAKRLEKLGLKKVGDLLEYFPFRYEDFSQPKTISSLRPGEEAMIAGKIITIKNERSPRRKMLLTRARIQERGETKSEIEALWFNQPFLVRTLRPGSEWFFRGKIQFNWQKQKNFFLSPLAEKEAGLLPVYSETPGLTSRYLRKIIRTIISAIKELPDFLPKEIMRRENLIKLNEALRKVHFPANHYIAQKARERLAFDELFLLALKLLLIKKEFQKEKAPAMKIDRDLLKKFTARLPYQLTLAQKKAAWEIILDLNKSMPMNRLLEGEVGSGKTVVAAMAVLVTAKNNYQTAWLAPTEILAGQHFNNVIKLLKPFNITIGLVTSNQAKISVEQKTTAQNTKKLALNTDLIIGTHALLQKDVRFKKLGLVIVDEQHRFGVAQRGTLRTQNLKSKSQNYNPHFLSMTATPIPRSLALALYGDLDLSIIDELPPGRQKIETKVVLPAGRQKIYQFIRAEIKKGHQAFVITPLIERKRKDKETNIFDFNFDFDNRKAAMEEYKKLQKEIFPEYKIGLLHGKMLTKEKSRIMSDFQKNKIQLLVSTSVIEVGIDIPNTTIILVEGAERFGLAQLHQFRGRVGRGKKQAYCFLFAGNKNEKTSARLKAMLTAKDGFELAQKDLEIRGPGQLAGTLQSGLPDLKMASLTDIVLIKRARKAAEEIIAKGIAKYPLLIEKIKEFGMSRHLE